MSAALAPPLPTPAARLRQSVLQAAGLLAAFAVFNLPILAFAVSAALLINASRDLPAPVRRLLGLVMIVAVSMMMSSRPVSGDGSDDLLGYYDLYLEYSSGDFERLFQFGGGLEVTLPFLFCLWGLVLPPLSPNGLMLCLTLTSAVLFWLWVETTFYGRRRPAADAALVGAALLLFNVYFSTQLARQFLALVVLLYACTATTTPRRLVFLALAMSFHLTALPFYLAYLLVRRGRTGVLALLALVLLVRLYFPVLLSLLDVLPDAVVDKLAYYVDNNAEYTDSDLAALKLIGLLAIVSLMAIVAQRFRPGAAGAWHAAPWLAAVVHVLLLPIPLASLRTTLAVHSVVTGVIAYRIVTERHRGLLLAVLNVLLLYKLAGFAALDGQAGLMPTLAVLANAVR